MIQAKPLKKFFLWVPPPLSPTPFFLASLFFVVFLVVFLVVFFWLYFFGCIFSFFLFLFRFYFRFSFFNILLGTF